MQNVLRCDIDDNFLVEATPNCENGTINTGQTSIRVSLVRRDQKDATPAAKTSVPWPQGEDLPSELSYIAAEQCIRLKNSTTIAQIPMKSQAFRKLAQVKSTNPEPARTFKSFTVNPTPCSDLTATLSAIREALNPENKNNVKKWKALKKRIEESEVGLAGCLTTTEQSQLLELLNTRAKDGNTSEDLCVALHNKAVFSYKSHSKFVEYCVSNNIVSTMDLILESHTALPETSLVKLMKVAVSRKEADGKKMLEKILSRSFSDKMLLKAASNEMTTQEAVMVIDWSAQIYNSIKKQALSDQILSVISILMDSHGSRMVWDSDAHEKVMEVIALITDMAALADVFATYETKSKMVTKPQQAEMEEFSLKKVKLSVRKMVW